MNKPDKSKFPKWPVLAAVIAIVVSIAAAAVVFRVTEPQKEAPKFEMKVERIETPAQLKDFPDLPKDVKNAFDLAKFHFFAPVEWWYVNAHLKDVEGNPFTLMFALLKNGALFGVITDVKAQRTVPIALTNQRVHQDGVKRKFTVGPSSITQPDAARLCYQLVLDQPAIGVDLEFCATKAPLAVNGTGEIQMGKAGKSAYFSITRAKVQGTGRHGERESRLSGTGWIDRQWGGWADTDFDRWDWMSLQIDGGGELLVFVFTLDGKVVHQIANYYPPEGEVEHGMDFTLTPTATWTSPATKATWDTAWTFAVPSRKATVTVTADVPSSEVDPVLWEGSVRFDGTWDGKPVTGQGFFEERRKTW
ncbi:MAG: hypothetical protein H6684_05215 [Deltaproteobacteria bacterium]|nr:hypothetical protein [Deltaproteobacteria bacterium]MCB9479047.1 hypothetical protein [Deltaproteobacteria bacterium]MCB9488109.1 hypothetical protein [Deltaproteobacteria bacterium]